MSRHSRLQKQVLGLYKQLLRAARDKPGFTPHIRAEFRRNAAFPRSDIMRIEMMMRRAQRQLEQLRDPSTRQMGAFSSTEPPGERA